MSGTTVLSGLIVAAAMTSSPIGSDGQVLKRIQLMPFGTFQLRGHGGETVTLDKAGAPAVIAASRAFWRSTDMMVDRDHQSIYSAVKGVGGQAAAAGWIKPDSLAVQDDGIWADVEWTASALDQLNAREYRYLSPVFTVDKTGRATRIHNVALTNSPAIEELAAAAAQQHQGTQMDLKKIAAALGLGEDATEAQICAAIAALNTTAASIRTALGAKDGDDLVAAAQTLKAAGAPDPSKFAPIAVVQQLQTQVTELVAASSSDKAAAAVNAAIEAGKITPATKDYWLASAARDLPAFEAYVAASAAIVPPGERKPLGERPAGRTTLTDEEQKLAASMGIPEDKFLANLTAKEASR